MYWAPLASKSQGLLLPGTCLMNTEVQCGVSLTAGKSENMKQQDYMKVEMANFQAPLAPYK